jgi:diketogulonate reductase-like aldo/keto reductase
LFGNRTIQAIASRHNVTPAQVVLAWFFRHPDVVVIPKAGRHEHIRENRAALDLQLTEKDHEELDQAFPLPQRKIPLETL